MVAQPKVETNHVMEGHDRELVIAIMSDTTDKALRHVVSKLDV